MLIAGIDPGVTGAFAILDDKHELISVEDLPIISDGALKWIDATALLPHLLTLKAGRPMHAIVERQQAMPAQGRSTAVVIGLALGSLLAILQAAACSIEFTTAAKWKGALGLSSDKGVSLNRARLLYPTAPLDRKRDHNRAEALLLAHHYLLRRSP